jgi:membrane protease YdiL (CAAX protease family)
VDPEPAQDRARPRWASGVINAFGMPLPVRETVVIAVTAFAIIVDYYHDLALPSSPILSQGIDRPLLFFVVPLATLLLLGERPSDYGLRLGNWRLGVPVMLAAMLVLTPVILWLSGLPDFIGYYRLDAQGARSVPHDQLGFALAGFAADVLSAEFLFRGFLMWSLVRAAGPAGILMATIPFVFAHLGKPELETLTTLAGGLAFSWLAWRTRSVLYGGLIHAFILDLLLIAVNR